ncbi:MAG: hypothetical protein JW869_06220 [Candidatus Omnitrophica bacterium]|nr:hypothetical protein [Candidatus Omnitrophota bacterium]
MKKLFKVIIIVLVVIVVVGAAALAYLNFIYFPDLVASKGAKLLEQKTKGRISAQSIQYVPLKGVELKEVSFLSQQKEPLFVLDRLYLNANPITALTKNRLDFNIQLYPQGKKLPLNFSGLYQIQAQHLDLNFALKNDFFLKRQDIEGKLSADIISKDEFKADLKLASADLDIHGLFSLKDKDVKIEDFSGNICGSTLKIIGDVQDIAKPQINCYGDLKVDLKGLKRLHPQLTKIPEELDLVGSASGTLFLTGSPDNPQAGLKLQSQKLKVDNISVADFSLAAEMKDKMVEISKIYAKTCQGEVNIESMCNLAVRELPAAVVVKISNIDLHQIIKDISGKERPFYGQVFAQAQLSAPLKDYKAVQGNLFINTSGANILRFPFFEKLANILQFSENTKGGFKQATGNFQVANETIRSQDLAILSDHVKIIFKGVMDFKGDLNVDVYPNFSQSFLTTSPNVGSILGILVDSTGNLLGEIKLTGNVKKPDWSFAPSFKKLFPGGVDQKILDLFPF